MSAISFLLGIAVNLTSARLQAAAAKQKLEARLAREAFPLDYSTTLRVVRDALLGISPAPVVISEGANTMDNARHDL